MTKILGADGDVAWVQASGIFAVNLKSQRIVREADLGKLNPELERFLNAARPEFTEHLVMVSPDWSQAYTFSAETFKATAAGAGFSPRKQLDARPDVQAPVPG